jgi:hypothetical protein
MRSATRWPILRGRTPIAFLNSKGKPPEDRKRIGTSLFRGARDTARVGRRRGRAEPPAGAPRRRGGPTGARPLGQVSGQRRVKAWARMTGRHVCLSQRRPFLGRGGAPEGASCSGPTPRIPAYPPRETSAWTCGWKFALSPKVWTTETIPGRRAGAEDEVRRGRHAEQEGFRGVRSCRDSVVVSGKTAPETFADPRALLGD